MYDCSPCHTPTQLSRFSQELVGTWSPSQVPAAGFWDRQVLRDVDGVSVFGGCADTIQTAKRQQHPEGAIWSPQSRNPQRIMTFMDQFVSRSAIFQNPDHRLAQGKTGQEADLAPDLWPDP